MKSWNLVSLLLITKDILYTNQRGKILRNLIVTIEFIMIINMLKSSHKSSRRLKNFYFVGWVCVWRSHAKIQKLTLLNSAWLIRSLSQISRRLNIFINLILNWVLWSKDITISQTFFTPLNSAWFICSLHQILSRLKNV